MSQTLDGWTLHTRTANEVPIDSPVFYKAILGDRVAVQKLIEQGLAAPNVYRTTSDGRRTLLAVCHRHDTLHWSLLILSRMP